jgi:hypothetical protein
MQYLTQLGERLISLLISTSSVEMISILIIEDSIIYSNKIMDNNHKNNKIIMNTFLIITKNKHSNILVVIVIFYRCPICIENLSLDKVAAMCGHKFCGKY